VVCRTLDAATDDTIGGAISAGVDGWFRGRYGSLRDQVLGLRLVTPAFGPIFLGSRVVKNVAGYNLVRLLVGSRGSLGVLTEVTVRVSPVPIVEKVWRLEGDRHHMDTQARAVEPLMPWASLTMTAGDGRTVLWAAYHGAAPTVSDLPEIGWEPVESGLPIIPTPTEDVLVAGCVPRSTLRDLMAVDCLTLLTADWLSGFYTGYVTSREQWAALQAWIAEVSGSVRVWRDESGLTLAGPADPLWTEVKNQYDPDGCLAEFWR